MQDIDVVVKLEILVCPARAEENDHPQVDQVVKYEVCACHGDVPAHWFGCKSQGGENEEVGEPDDVAQGQDDIEMEGCQAVLDKVNLPHFVEEIDQHKESVHEIDPACIALVIEI